MAHADLVVLAGVGILALACLVVCVLHVYWSSERYHNRQRRLDRQKAEVRAAAQDNGPSSGVQATMGTQLSHRCKTSLFRAAFSHAHSESIVFLIAASREEARQRATAALAAIYGIGAQNVGLSNLASYQELVDVGVSDDEDLRIFELGWKGSEVSAWIEHPLFLSDDPSLLGKWAELYADLARELAVATIDKARH